MRQCSATPNPARLLYRALICATLLLLAQGSLAAKAPSIHFVENVVTDTSVYSHYEVQCSNNNRKDISAWNNAKSWCLGKGLRNYCKKKRYRTVRKACADKTR